MVSSPLAAEIAIARSVSRALANTGSGHASANCSPRPTSMSCSLCHRNWLRSLCRTKRSSTVCCCGPAPKPFRRWRGTPHISGLRSLLQRAAYLEPETPDSSPCPLCRRRGWALAGSHPLDPISPALLSSPSRAPAGVSRQVRRQSQVGLSAVSQKLGGLLETTLRRPRVCASLSRPLQPPRRHLQPSTGIVGRRPSHLSLARFGGPQSKETDDPLAR
jgi:hypothetical protein